MPSKPTKILAPKTGAEVTAHSLQLLAASVQQVIDEQLKTYFCSLKTITPRPIPPHVWTQVRFDAHNRDDDHWHADDDLTRPHSALIVPTVTKVGLMAAMAQFLSGTGDATQISMRFNRDPFGVLPDTTATQDFGITTGSQFRVGVWPIILKAGQPLAFDLRHDAGTAITLDLAEFKVWCPPGSDLSNGTTTTTTTAAADLA